MALAEGDGWLAKGTDILLFGPPGVGKKARFELKEKLKNLTFFLSDEGTRIAVQVVEVLAEHRALSAK